MSYFSNRYILNWIFNRNLLRLEHSILCKLYLANLLFLDFIDRIRTPMTCDPMLDLSDLSFAQLLFQLAFQLLSFLLLSDGELSDFHLLSEIGLLLSESLQVSLYEWVR